MTTQNPTVSFRHILVPTDFGEPSARAVEVAVDLAAKYGATITLVHVCEVPPYVSTGAFGIPADFLTPIRVAAEKQLDVALAVLKRRVADATGVLEFGAPWHEILQQVTETKADLVVMGTHGRRGIVHAVLGSVAEKIVRACPVPVLTIH